MDRINNNPRIWWLLYAASFLLPWIFTFASHEVMLRWFPGQVEINHWRDLSSLSFLIGGFAAAILLTRTPQAFSIRAFGALAVITGSVGLALFFQIQPRCEEESARIGHRADVQVASCS